MADIERFDFEQGSPEWYAVRKGIPTATDFGSIITPVKGEPVKGGARRKLIANLIDQIVRPDAPESFQGNRHTERGKELEPEAIRVYEMLNDVKVKPVGFIRNNALGAGGSPDGEVGAHGELEVKCPDGPTHVLYMMEGVLPDEYKTQVHARLAIGKKKWIDFVSYCPGHPLFVVRVVRSQYTDLVEIALRDFNAEFASWKQKLISSEESPHAPRNQ